MNLSLGGGESFPEGRDGGTAELEFIVSIKGTDPVI